ncbi:MAG: DMT family transporter, partial [Gemmatimonadaceae bacterium]|nr:DMT family transporter [Gemmatimonadaceae bacterium]
MPRALAAGVATMQVTSDAGTSTAPAPGALRSMAVGAFWFSVMTTLAKLAGRTLPSSEVVMARAVFTLALGLWGVRGLARPFGTQTGLLVTRGLLGALALNCFFWSVTHLPLAEASVIQYTNPVFAAVFAMVLLKERVTRATLMAIGGAVIGTVLVANPPWLAGASSAPLPLHGVLIALTGAIASAAAYVTIRRIGPRERPQTVVLYLPLCTIPAMLPFLGDAAWRWPTPVEWALLVGISIATQLAQLAMTRGLQGASAARATA